MKRSDCICILSRSPEQSEREAKDLKEILRDIESLRMTMEERFSIGNFRIILFEDKKFSDDYGIDFA